VKRNSARRVRHAVILCRVSLLGGTLDAETLVLAKKKFSWDHLSAEWLHGLHLCKKLCTETFRINTSLKARLHHYRLSISSTIRAVKHTSMVATGSGAVQTACDCKTITAIYRILLPVLGMNASIVIG